MMKKFLWFLLGTTALVGLGAGIVVWELAEDGTKLILRTRGELTWHAEGESQKDKDAGYSQDVHLFNEKNMEVAARVRVIHQKSAKKEEKLPAFVLLDGINLGRKVVDYFEPVRDSVVLSMDYEPYGVTTGNAVVRAGRIRGSIIRNLARALLLIDYAFERPDVDPHRVILVGVSLGAPYAVVAGALHPRVAGVASFYGGGRLGLLVAHSLGKHQPSWFGKVFIGGFFQLVLSAVEPIKFVEHIAPRPYLMVASTDDPEVPRESAQDLFRVAKDPKEIRWVSTAHISREAKDIIQSLVTYTEEWGLKTGLLPKQ